MRLPRTYTCLAATLGPHLSFPLLAMQRLLQLVGDWLVKNIRTDPTQRFVAARIRLAPRVSEPAFCSLPRSLPQSGCPLKRAPQCNGRMLEGFRLWTCC